MSQENLTVTVDKFTFQIPNDLLYSDAGVWVKPEGDRARLGLSDFTQTGRQMFADGPVQFIPSSRESLCRSCRFSWLQSPFRIPAI